MQKGKWWTSLLCQLLIIFKNRVQFWYKLTDLGGSRIEDDLDHEETVDEESSVRTNAITWKFSEKGKGSWHEKDEDER